MPEQEHTETNQEPTTGPRPGPARRGDVGWAFDRGCVPSAIDQAMAGINTDTASDAPLPRRSAQMTLPAGQLMVRAGRLPRTPIVVLTDTEASYEISFEGTFGDLLAMAYDVIDKIEVAAPEYRRRPDADVVEARAILVEDVLRTLGVPQAGPDLEVTELGQTDIRSARRLAQRAVDLLDRVVAR